MVDTSLHRVRVVFQGICHFEPVVKIVRVFRHIDIDLNVLKHLFGSQFEGVHVASLGGDATSCTHRHSSALTAQEFSLNNRPEAERISTGRRFAVPLTIDATFRIEPAVSVVLFVRGAVTPVWEGNLF